MGALPRSSCCWCGCTCSRSSGCLGVSSMLNGSDCRPEPAGRPVLLTKTYGFHCSNRSRYKRSLMQGVKHEIRANFTSDHGTDDVLCSQPAFVCPRTNSGTRPYECPSGLDYGLPDQGRERRSVDPG